MPRFQEGIRGAARESGADYLDASRLFHGHEVCLEDAWARGLTVDLTNPFPPDSNSVRQSFHPNARGHGAYAECLTRFYEAGLGEAACADPEGAGRPELYPWARDDVFAPLRNGATGTCLDAAGESSRDGTEVRGRECHGERNQGWWHDGATGQVHTELTHDRCLDVPGGVYADGARLVLWNCRGGADQRFERVGDTLRPVAAEGLCLTLAGGTERVRLRPCDGSRAQDFH